MYLRLKLLYCSELWQRRTIYGFENPRYKLDNLVSRVSHRGGKMRDPGTEVANWNLDTV